MLFSLGLARAQTYDINGQGSAAPDKQAQKPSSQNAQSGTDFSWGSGIDVARQARAAQDALNRNDYANAVSYAQQAAKSAPQNAELWFLLGYAARLDDKYPLSVDSYNHGLRLQPNSVRGLAGLAQTYAKMGRDREAEELLAKVVNANPKDANSLQLAGELLLNSDPKHSLELLQRADSLQPSAHSDLLIAHAYTRWDSLTSRQNIWIAPKAGLPTTQMCCAPLRDSIAIKGATIRQSQPCSQFLRETPM